VLPYSLTAGDASVVTVSEGMEGLCVSSKLYTSLATGQPSLVISSPDDDEARIIESYDAGVQVRQGDVDRVVEVVDRWQSDPELVERLGQNAGEAFEANFTKGHCVDDYYRLLSEREDETKRERTDGQEKETGRSTSGGATEATR